MHEVRACNDKPLSEALEWKDCVWDEWAPYGFCSKTCGGGQRARSREIHQLRVGGGKECEGAQKETAPCNTELCNTLSEADQDCQWAPWSAWAACSATCGGGETKRYRYISHTARNYGKECVPEDSREVEPCNEQPCGEKLFCVWAEWGSYTPCSTTCGSGTKKRSRNLESSHHAPVGEALDTTYLAIAGVTFSGPSALALSGSAGFAVVVGTVLLARRARRSSYGSVQE
jgi:hemicentin